MRGLGQLRKNTPKKKKRRKEKSDDDEKGLAAAVRKHGGSVYRILDECVAAEWLAMGGQTGRRTDNSVARFHARGSNLVFTDYRNVISSFSPETGNASRRMTCSFLITRRHTAST
jgi:hypothetical protein